MANSWWEIQILSDPILDDLIFWRLEKFGCRGTASEIKGHSCLIRAYLPQSQSQLLDLAALSLLLRQDALAIGMPIPAVQWHIIDEEDWASSWKQYWQPQEIGDRFVIYPAWLTIPEGIERYILRLDPGVAFGTGNHATTQLCLEALEMRLALFSNLEAETTPTDLVLADIGCGSGILSIGAVLLGAAKVYAVDVDPLAIRSTESNRQLNNIDSDRLVADQGSLERVLELSQRPVDGFMCNILAEVIIDLVPHLGSIAHEHTWGILSGILLEQAKAVADTLEQNGWVVATLWRRQDWCCLNIRRS